MVLTLCFAAMGNRKSNAYWEAELPLHYDSNRIENFTQAKYGLIGKLVLRGVVLLNPCPKNSCSKSSNLF